MYRQALSCISTGIVVFLDRESNLNHAWLHNTIENLFHLLISVYLPSANVGSSKRYRRFELLL
ncbi:hypothetical protein ACSBR2_032262 [Camellia fascicularis]